MKMQPRFPGRIKFLQSLTFLQSLAAFACLTSVSWSEEAFEFIQTADLARLGDRVPEGVGSIESDTGEPEFATARVDTNGKRGTFGLGLPRGASVPSDDERAAALFQVGVLGQLIRDEASGLFEFNPDQHEAVGEAVVAAANINTFAATQTVGDSDPYLAQRIEVTNPFNEEILFRFEAALEIVPLEPITAVGEGRFRAEVFDTGGDPGASLEFSLGHTLRQADSGQELSAPVSHFGDITDGEVSALDVGPATGFAVALEDFDRILSSAFLTLSPGDRAVVTMIGSFGDQETPTRPLGGIEAKLTELKEFADSIVVPEPSGTMMLLLAAITAGLHRRADA